MSDTQAPPPVDEAEDEANSIDAQNAEITGPVEEPASGADLAAPVESETEIQALDETATEAAIADVGADVKEEAQDEVSSAESEAVEQPEEIDDGREWFVVHSYSGYENKVKKNLEHRIESMNMQDKIFQVVVPTEEEIEIREGDRRRTKKRVFPGYILVQMLMDEESWYVVRNTPGVTGFVGSGTKPTPLRKQEVDKIFSRMEAEAPKIKVSFREGQTVRITDGPFADFVGVVEEMNLDKGKVTVMVSFFGRETPVELDFLQVQKQ
jgi:transcriptional antiterminator NusG